MATRRKETHGARPRAACSGRVIAACLLVLGGAAAAVAATRASLVGTPAPALVAPAMESGTVDLAALRGHVVVLNLWASWCPPCRAELPMLARLQERHRADGLVLIALSADHHRDRADARRALAGLTVTGAFMDGASSNGYANPDVLPVTYVIGPDGIVRGEFLPGRGALQESALEAVITPLLPAPAAP